MKRVRSYLCNRMHTLPLTIVEIFVFNIYCMLCTSLAPSSISFLAMFARNPLVSLWLSWRMWKIARDSGILDSVPANNTDRECEQFISCHLSNEQLLGCIEDTLL